MTDSPPSPVFAEPWHAQVFALTVHLHDRGLFSWPDWAAQFGAELARAGLSKELDGGEDYFTAWLAALEDLLMQDAEVAPQAVEEMRAAWERAYLSTPHGAPVKLA